MANIHNEAKLGTLTQKSLEGFLKAQPDVIDKLDGSNYTPLSYALLNGHTSTTQLLLRNNANPDYKLPDGRTPTYLAADAPGSNSTRARLVQLVLEKNPASFDDPVDSAARKHETPLMMAVRHKDPLTVKQLIDAGASLEKKNDDGQTALDIAKQLGDQKVLDALNTAPSKGRGGLRNYINNFVLYVLGYFKILAPLKSIFGAAAQVFNKIQDEVPEQNLDEPASEKAIKGDLTDIVAEKNLEKFFPKGDPYLDEVAKKAAELKDDPQVLLKKPKELKGLANLALYQPIIYCDDSSSMQKEGRWEGQQKLVQRITKITNIAVPNEKGASVRFINSAEAGDNLQSEAAGAKLNFKPYGWTPIGSGMNSHVLEPLIYSKLDKGETLERPYLVMILTDGVPCVSHPGKPGDEEKAIAQATNDFRKAVLDSGRKLNDKGYRTDAVRFCLCQVGKDEEAKDFIDSMTLDDDLMPVMHVIAEIMDVTFEELEGTEESLEAWLLHTLLAPLLYLNKS